MSIGYDKDDIEVLGRFFATEAGQNALRILIKNEVFRISFPDKTQDGHLAALAMALFEGRRAIVLELKALAELELKGEIENATINYSGRKSNTSKSGSDRRPSPRRRRPDRGTTALA